MKEYSSLTNVPTQFIMINPINSSNKANISKNKNNDICQQSFTHFQGNGKGNVYWGSEKPMKEVCLKDLQAHTGTPNHSIWNNSTKRKTIVDRVV
tara:strand:+ start:379 stop:663 length:285 start_codon:yes stop_codon:yes gene_type:complete